LTTIAYRAGVLAADTLHTWNGTRDLYEPKAWRVGDKLVAASGSTSLIMRFREWVAAGMEGESPMHGVEKGGNGLVVTADGVTCFDIHGSWPVREEHYALGSGSDIATGAMAMGATAEEAVRAAIRFDTGSGGEITVLRLAEITNAEDVLPRGAPAKLRAPADA